MPELDTGLRARLIEVGIALLAREGAQALSLREIARQAGVSHGAPRRYFPTHQALLAAIAQEGYRQLGEQFAAIADGEPAKQILDLGQRYLAFARDHRGMFELMFRHDLLQGNNIGLRQEALPLFGVLVELVARTKPKAEPAIVASALWANLHGIAQLWHWGSLQMTAQTADVEALLRTALDAYVP
jgi:AcrR family transcriptional regulator